MEITSRDNRYIRDFCRLSAEVKYRRESGLFAMEGARLCTDAVRSGIEVQTVLFTAHAKNTYPQAVELLSGVAPAFEISDALAGKLADTASPQGVFCIARLPHQPPLDGLSKTGRYAALETVQDPGNLGTMIRTAEAFGLNGVLLSDGCCDPYNPKVLRGSMGGVFRLPLYAAGDLTKTLPQLQQWGLTAVAFVVDGEATPIEQIALGAGTVAVIGNEGNGLKKPTVEVCRVRATIPMAGRAESLNASMAAGIVFWEMVRAHA